MKKLAFIFFLISPTLIFSQNNFYENFLRERFSIRATPSFSRWHYRSTSQKISFQNYSNGTIVTRKTDYHNHSFNANGIGINFSLMARVYKPISIGLFHEIELLAPNFSKNTLTPKVDGNASWGGIIEFQTNDQLFLQLMTGYEYGSADGINGYRYGGSAILFFTKDDFLKYRIGLKITYEIKRFTDVDYSIPKLVNNFNSAPYISTYKVETKVDSQIFKVGIFVLIQGVKRYNFYY